LFSPKPAQGEARLEAKAKRLIAERRRGLPFNPVLACAGWFDRWKSTSFPGERAMRPLATGRGD
jgi:hypothetical protein